MKKKINISKFKINVFSNLIIKTLGAVIPFILSPFVSRALLPQGLGSFTYAHSIVSYFSIVIAFGFLNYGTKKIAEKRKNTIERSHLFWNITYVKFALFAITSVIYLLIINIFDLTKGFDKSIYFALYISLIGVVFDTTFYFQGVEKMFGFSIVNLSVNVIYTFLVICFVRTPEQLLLYTIFKSSIILLTSIASLPLILKDIKYLPKPKWNTLKTIFLQSLLFFIPSLILTITPIIDQTMLGSMTNTTEVGYYEAANKIKTIALVFTTAISSILLSRVSFLKSAKEEKDAHNKIISSLDVSLFILLPLVVGVCLVADLFIPLYFGDDFKNSINIMYWLAPSTFFSAVVTLLIFGYYFATGKTKKITVIILICDLINLLTNFIAIRLLGAAGAAVTSSIANGIMMLLCILYSKDEINYSKLLNNLTKYAISVVSMVFSVLIFKIGISKIGIKSLPIQVSLLVAIGIVGYFLTFLAIKDYKFSFLRFNKDKLKEKKKGISICHFSFGLKPYKIGGSPAFVDYLLNLQKQDNDLLLLYPGHYNLFSKKPYIKKGGLYKHDKRFKCFEIVNPKPIPICNGIKNIEQFTKNYSMEMWDSFFRNNHIDIIHIHTLFGLDETFFESCKKNGIKTIYTSHDLFGICPKVPPLFKQYCQLKPCELCSVCSKYAFTNKRNIILQSNLYNKFKNTKIIQNFRQNRVNERVKLQSDLIGISKEDIFKFSAKESEKYSSLQKYYIGLLNSIDYIHFNSELSERTFLEFINPIRYSTVPISNGKISDKRHLHTKQVNGDMINFLILGTGKGMYAVIDLLNDIWEKGRKNFKLTIYSKNNCNHYDFIEKHDAYSIEQESDIFDNADCLIFNENTFATFSFIVYESLSYGVPCITCGEVGANQQVSATKGGKVIAIESLKDTIISILDNPSIISEWQRNLSNAKMNFEKNSFVDLYRDVINKNN